MHRPSPVSSRVTSGRRTMNDSPGFVSMAEQRPDRTPRKNGRSNPGGGGGGSGPNGGGGRIPFGRGLFGWVLFIGLAVMLFIILTSKSRGSQSIKISELR